MMTCNYRKANKVLGTVDAVGIRVIAVIEVLAGTGKKVKKVLRPRKGVENGVTGDIIWLIQIRPSNISQVIKIFKADGNTQPALYVLD